MSIFSVYVEARKRIARTVLRRRLHGNARAAARAARKYLAMALAYDARTQARTPDVDASKLIFAGEAKVITKANAVLTALDAALASKTSIVKP